MESKDKGEPVSKIPIIFKSLTNFQMQNLLETHGAKTRESKAVFLICDSHKCPGLASVSYYSQEEDMFLSQKLGLTSEGWKLGPKPPQAPKMMDSFETKEKYKHDKQKFDEEMQAFISNAKLLFDQNVDTELIKTLGIELQDNDFKLDGLIKPNREQASQEKHFINYISALFLAGDNFNRALSEPALW